ncbi:Error-prone repair protein ImuA [Flavihumibacter sp. R14]|nr:Error-prone repair protein ImuA [Flavihumibacter soli]
MLASKKDIITELQKNILHWQGFKVPLAGTTRFAGLEQVESAFPNAVFPTGAIHEFLTEEPEHAAACGGFLGGLLQVLMERGGICLWISTARSLFPPALKTFGVNPDRIIFIDLKREKELLWAMEEALKCSSLAAVVAEVGEISFTESRRLQLVVEKSRVTGFILRGSTKKLSTTACVARWKITPLPSELKDGMPGVGFPRWNVELLKVRNGNPGSWKLEWHAGSFRPLMPEKANYLHREKLLKVG